MIRLDRYWRTDHGNRGDRYGSGHRHCCRSRFCRILRRGCGDGGRAGTGHGGGSGIDTGCGDRPHAGRPCDGAGEAASSLDGGRARTGLAGLSGWETGGRTGDADRSDRGCRRRIVTAPSTAPRASATDQQRRKSSNEGDPDRPARTSCYAPTPHQGNQGSLASVSATA